MNVEKIAFGCAAWLVLALGIFSVGTIIGFNSGNSVRARPVVIGKGEEQKRHLVVEDTEGRPSVLYDDGKGGYVSRFQLEGNVMNNYDEQVRLALEAYSSERGVASQPSR